MVGVGEGVQQLVGAAEHVEREHSGDQDADL
jgi:hypothetical protein